MHKSQEHSLMIFYICIHLYPLCRSWHRTHAALSWYSTYRNNCCSYLSHRLAVPGFERSYKCNTTVLNLLCLNSFTLHYISEVYPLFTYRINLVFFIFHSIPLYLVYHNFCIHSTVMDVFLLAFSYWKHHCYKDSSTCLLVDTSMHCCWIYVQQQKYNWVTRLPDKRIDRQTDR